MKKYFINHKWKMLFATSLIIIVTILNTLLAITTKELVDAGTSKDLMLFKNTLLKAGVVIFLFLLFEYRKKISVNNLIKNWSIDLKNDVFGKLIARQPTVFNNDSTGEYISTLTNDITMIKDTYFSSIISLINTLLQFTITVYALLNLSVTIGIVIICFSALPLFIPKVTEIKLSKRKELQSKNLSLFTSRIKDVFEGFHVIKSYNIHSVINHNFKKINYNSEDAECSYKNFNSLVNILAAFCAYGMMLACISIGAYLVIKDEISIGVLVASIQLMEIVDMAVLDFTYEIIDLKSIKAIKTKMVSIINEDISHEEGIEMSSFETAIELNNVSFSYISGVEVLKNINLSIEKGKKYAVVGQSGCGKSTLLNLILRFYNEYDGKILIDGIDIRRIKLSNIYKLISSIHQDTFMFDSTIIDNICLFTDYSDNEIEKTLKLASLYDYVCSHQDRTNMLVGEGGTKLSGGEKQRVAIARAIIKNTPILLLDEATSSLDNQTSVNIENSILNLENITSVVITHTLSSSQLKKYDSIIVMRDGNISEIGSYSDLMNNKSYFYNLVNVETGIQEMVELEDNKEVIYNVHIELDTKS